MRMLISKLLSMPKSLAINIKIFGWGGVKLPMLVSYKTVVRGLYKNCIQLEQFQGRVYYGFGGSEGVCENRHNYLLFGQTGKLILKGKSHFSAGISIRVDSGETHICNNVSFNKNCSIFCRKFISVGENTIVGWNVQIRDDDGHTIIKQGVRGSSESVCIGNNVWIAAYVDVLKGAKISDNSVIGMRSVVTKKFGQSNALIAGVPARVIVEGISWEK